jgi:hypothetical protein
VGYLEYIVSCLAPNSSLPLVNVCSLSFTRRHRFGLGGVCLSVWDHVILQNAFSSCLSERMIDYIICIYISFRSNAYGSVPGCSTFW